MNDPAYLPYGHRPPGQQQQQQQQQHDQNINSNKMNTNTATGYPLSATTAGGTPLYAQVAGSATGGPGAPLGGDARKQRYNTVQGLADDSEYRQASSGSSSNSAPAQQLADRSLPNTTISGLPGLPDYSIYASALAGMTGGGAAGAPMLQQNSHGSSNSMGGGNPAGLSFLAAASALGSHAGAASSGQGQQQQQQQQGHGGGYAPSLTSSQGPSIHQRTMSAMAGLGQGIGQQYGQSNNPGLSGPYCTAPQYGLVGPAGFSSSSSPQQPFSGSPLANTLPYGLAGQAGPSMSGAGGGVGPAGQGQSPSVGGAGANAGPTGAGSLPSGPSGSNPLPNMASPAAQTMSAMSSLSGIPSSNTSASGGGFGGGATPISPATVYTPGFTSPSLSQQAAFNAAAAAGLGVGGINFGAFGLPNLPLGGLGIASIPMGSPSISQQMSNMSLSNDGQAYQPIRTVYVGNLPGDASVDELLSQVRYGPIENVKIIPDKSCAFISFLDPATAAAFHSDANLRKVQLHGQDLKIGWGKPMSIPAQVMQAVQQHGATRNVYLGNLDETYTEQTLRDELSKFGHIDQVKIVRDKNIGFVHFLSISTAMKVVSDLPREAAWQGRRVNYGKDRCAYVPRNQHQQQLHNQLAASMAQQAANQAMSPFNPLSPAIMPPMSPVMSPMAFSGGFDTSALGNRTVYLGNLHPDTTAEDVCNTIRGGILQEVRHIPDKHICFVTFVMPESALALMNTAVTQGISIKNRRLKVGWGKNHGPCPPGISAIVNAGGSRNVYIGNIDDFVTFTTEKIKADLAEFGEIEQVNLLEEKSCAFTNFTKISSAVKAIEGLKQHPEYGRFKIAYGKDRVGNMARAPMPRRPHHYRRDSNQQGLASSQAHYSDAPSTPAEPRNEGTLSPQLDAAVHAAAAVDQAEQSQGIKSAQ